MSEQRSDPSNMRVQQLEAALKPFADQAAIYDRIEYDGVEPCPAQIDDDDVVEPKFKVRVFRQARDAYNGRTK